MLALEGDAKGRAALQAQLDAAREKAAETSPDMALSQLHRRVEALRMETIGPLTLPTQLAADLRAAAARDRGGVAGDYILCVACQAPVLTVKSDHSTPHGTCLYGGQEGAPSSLLRARRCSDALLAHTQTLGMNGVSITASLPSYTRSC